MHGTLAGTCVWVSNLRICMTYVNSSKFRWALSTKLQGQAGHCILCHSLLYVAKQLNSFIPFDGCSFFPDSLSLVCWDQVYRKTVMSTASSIHDYHMHGSGEVTGQNVIWSLIGKCETILDNCPGSSFWDSPRN